MSDLGMTTREVDNVTILDLSGRIALGETSAAVSSKLKELAAEGNRRILINLSDVPSIDSSGLGSLVAGFTSITNSGGQLKLTNLSPRLNDLMTITKLYTVFELFDDEKTAVASFAQEESQTTNPLDEDALPARSGSSVL